MACITVSAEEEIVPAVEIVVNRTLGIGVERVEREIATLGVGAPVVGESDDGPAAVGLDVAAQGGDLLSD